MEKIKEKAWEAWLSGERVAVDLHNSVEGLRIGAIDTIQPADNSFKILRESSSEKLGYYFKDVKDIRFLAEEEVKNDLAECNRRQAQTIEQQDVELGKLENQIAAMTRKEAGETEGDVAKQVWKAVPPHSDERLIWWAGGQKYILKASSNATDEQVRVAAAAPGMLAVLEMLRGLQFFGGTGVMEISTAQRNEIIAIVKRARGLTD